MLGQSQRKRVLITVRTYPTPARKGVEVSCTAGVTNDGQWLRLFPVPYRRLPLRRRFKKYDWVDLEVTKASDSRPESYTPNLDSIEINGKIGRDNGWAQRKELLLPLADHCLCCLVQKRDASKFPTLGLFRPKKISRLAIEPDDAVWSPDQLARLRQASFFDEAPANELEKIPFKFKYVFTCDESGCRTHALSCTDWEMIQSCRSWRKEYGRNWESKFRQKYEDEMINRKDLHFFVGTLHRHPATWIIVGLFYPPLPSPQGALL